MGESQDDQLQVTDSILEPTHELQLLGLSIYVVNKMEKLLIFTNQNKTIGWPRDVPIEVRPPGCARFAVS
jgi:hypothetical protein